jgi:hypothetical protein
MIDPFNISLDIRDRGWVSEVEPHPHKFDEFNGAPFGSAQGTPFQWIIFYMDYPKPIFDLFHRLTNTQNFCTKE